MIKKHLFGSLFLILLPFIVQAQSIRTIDRDILESIHNLDSPFINGYCDFSSLSAPVISIGLPVGMFLYSLIEKKPIP